MRVLLAVPSESVAGVLDALLSARGFEVQKEKNGAKVIELVEASTPDAVVLAVEVVGPFDGLEVCKRLRARDPQLPVLVLGSSADEDLRARAVEAGCTGFYTVPVSASALVKELESIRPRAS
jgi:DNA-binding response OmpR family regulator